MMYGPDLPAFFARSASDVDKILKVPSPPSFPSSSPRSSSS